MFPREGCRGKTHRLPHTSPCAHKVCSAVSVPSQVGSSTVLVEVLTALGDILPNMATKLCNAGALTFKHLFLHGRPGTAAGAAARK